MLSAFYLLSSYKLPLYFEDFVYFLRFVQEIVNNLACIRLCGYENWIW